MEFELTKEQRKLVNAAQQHTVGRSELHCLHIKKNIVELNL